MAAISILLFVFIFRYYSLNEKKKNSISLISQSTVRNKALREIAEKELLPRLREVSVISATLGFHSDFYCAMRGLSGEVLYIKGYDTRGPGSFYVNILSKKLSLNKEVQRSLDLQYGYSLLREIEIFMPGKDFDKVDISGKMVNVILEK